MFSSAEMLEAESLLGEAFDSFKETITIFKTPLKTIVSTVSSDYNFAFGMEQPSISISEVVQSGSFYATVEYADTRDDQRLSFPDQNMPVKQNQGWGRISISGASGADFLRKAEVVKIDGRDFNRQSDVLPRGLFSRNSYDCWLQKIDNGSI